MRRALRAAPLVGLMLAGCSVGGGEPVPEPVRGAPRDVARVVAKLDAATRRGQYRRICDELFTSAARRRAGGRDCPSLLRSTARELRNPSVELVAIRVTSREAHARVRTRAAGQAPIADVLVLRRERGAYRIEALT
ncbi:MAG: hypothetical protein M3433_04905 [Actinomycetota bacterium]|nr:hypothetical protein [Actinomycetota bacterium]MDQ3647909.1 hypothetical protein [Actinomycetota bacterium]